MSTEPNTGLTYQEPGSLQTDALQNELVNYLGVWLNCAVQSVGQAAPTGSEIEGDRYIVGTGTGVFAGHDDELAILRGGTWQFHEANEGVSVRNLDDAEDWINEGSGGWAVKAGGGGGISDAPADGTTYGRKDNAWEPISAGGGSVGVLNALFEPPLTSLVPLMTTNTAPAGVVSASSTFSGVSAHGAFNAADTGWVNAGGFPAWIAYEAAGPITVKSYGIIPWLNDTVPGRWLRAWRLEGSNDGISWTTIDTQSIHGKRWAWGAFRYFSCAGNTTAYLHHRLNISANNGDTYCGLQRLELYDQDITALSP